MSFQLKINSHNFIKHKNLEIPNIEHFSFKCFKKNSLIKASHKNYTYAKELGTDFEGLRTMPALFAWKPDGALNFVVCGVEPGSD